MQRLTHYPTANTLSNQRIVGHTVWAPEERKGQSQETRLQLEVGALDF